MSSIRAPDLTINSSLPDIVGHAIDSVADKRRTTTIARELEQRVGKISDTGGR